MLAFLGAGHSHLSKETHDGIHFGETVLKAVQWMLGEQGNDGLVGSRERSRYLLQHAIQALALAELGGVSGSVLCRDQTQAAVNFTLAAQNPGKAWRYSTRCGDNDTSVTFWALLSLGVGRELDYTVREPAFAGVRAWLDEVTSDSFRAGYTHKGSPKTFIPGINEHFDDHESMTAASCFLRMLMGSSPKEPSVHNGLDLVLRDKPAWGKLSTDYYYWHMATLALFQEDGPAGPRWNAWNDAMKQALLPNQTREGCARGSWEPVGRWCPEGGRVASTALAVLTLETYYRYRLIPKD